MIVKERCCPQCGSAMYSKPVDGFMRGDRPPYVFECSVCGRTEFYSADNLLIGIPGEKLIDVGECARCNQCDRIPVIDDEISYRLMCEHQMAGWDKNVLNMEICPKKQYVTVADKAVPKILYDLYIEFIKKDLGAPGYVLPLGNTGDSPEIIRDALYDEILEYAEEDRYSEWAKAFNTFVSVDAVAIPFGDD